MRQVKIASIISQSFDRTENLLFSPFDFKKFLKWFFIAALAGSLCSGFNFFGMGPGKSSPNLQKPAFVYQSKTQSHLGAGGNQRSSQLQHTASAKTPQNSYAMVGFIILGFFIVFMITLGLVMCWLSSRFQFIWFHTVVHNEVMVKQAFELYKKPGNSLFRLMLLMFLPWFLCMGMGIGAFALFFLGQVLWTSVLGVIAVSLAFVMLIVLMVYIPHFVVPIMAMDQCGFKEAWYKFSNIYRQNIKDFWLFLLILLGIQIVIGIAVLLLVLVVIICFILVALFVFGIPFLILALLLHLKIGFMIYAIIVAIPFFIAMMIAMGMTMLPFSVFIKNFCLYFFTSLNCGYAPLALAADNNGQPKGEGS